MLSRKSYVCLKIIYADAMIYIYINMYIYIYTFLCC